MGYKKWIAAATVLLGAAIGSAHAVEVAGIRYEETARVGTADLKLNGAGIRYKAIFKVYTAGLYLKDKKSTVADVLASTGPRRVLITMLRDVSSEDFSRGFMSGIQKNTEKVEKARLTSQFLRFGELFAAVPELRKGDVLMCDWIPDVGTVMTLNGKRMGEPYPDITFNNAILRIWLGDYPVDNGLKRALLNE